MAGSSSRSSLLPYLRKPRPSCTEPVSLLQGAGDRQVRSGRDRAPGTPPSLPAPPGRGLCLSPARLCERKMRVHVRVGVCARVFVVSICMDMYCVCCANVGVLFLRVFCILSVSSGLLHRAKWPVTGSCLQGALQSGRAPLIWHFLQKKVPHWSSSALWEKFSWTRAVRAPRMC